jgi:hypothetical protein
VIQNVTAPTSTDELRSGLRVCAALWEGDLENILTLRADTRHADVGVRWTFARLASS